MEIFFSFNKKRYLCKRNDFGAPLCHLHTYYYQYKFIKKHNGDS